MTTREFRWVLDQLPIPVIGIPWFQAQHLPDALVVAHEVGHHVESELHLSHSARAALRTGLATAPVPEARRQALSAWMGEVFADTYATLVSWDQRSCLH